MLLRKVIYGISILLLITPVAWAQQAPLYSQYILNGFLLNPAMAGAVGFSSVNLTARDQWIGLTDGPSTVSLSFNTKLSESSFAKRKPPYDEKSETGFSSGKVGIGGYIFSDHYGGQGRTGVRMSYAYHLYNKEYRSRLSFGFSLIAYQLKFDEDWVILKDPDDDIWLAAREPLFITDADAGLYFSTPAYFIGFSVDQLLESTIKFGAKANKQYKMDRVYYLYGGYDFYLSEKLSLTPSTFVKYAENIALQADFSLKLMYNQKFWGGLSYRTGDALVVLTGLSIDKYLFGYSFDISLSNIMRHSLGSHEFVFAYKWGEQGKRHRWMLIK